MTVAKILLRRGTAAEWAAANPVLDDGEPGFETDVNRLRIGDGVTAFTSLVQYQGPQGVAGPTGASGWAPRVEATVTTGSLAPDEPWTGNITMQPGYRLLRIETNRPARVRVYDTVANRTADVDRPIGTDPTGQHGLVLEYVTTAVTLAAFLNPIVDGASNESTPSASIPIAITNLDDAAGAVEVALTYTRTE